MKYKKRIYYILMHKFFILYCLIFCAPTQAHHLSQQKNTSSIAKVKSKKKNIFLEYKIIIFIFFVVIVFCIYYNNLSKKHQTNTSNIDREKIINNSNFILTKEEKYDLEWLIVFEEQRATIIDIFERNQTNCFFWFFISNIGISLNIYIRFDNIVFYYSVNNKIIYRFSDLQIKFPGFNIDILPENEELKNFECWDRIYTYEVMVKKNEDKKK